MGTELCSAMKQSQLDALYAWFDSYVEPFLDTDEDGARNIRLKIYHTRKVCEAMEQLAIGEKLSEPDRHTASAAALLHDVGRFPQYKRWRTFRDSESDNHARLSIDVIRAEKILAGLAQEEQLAIEEAVRFHNLLAPPAQTKSLNRLFINLIRDADKLDIWRVFVELLGQPPEQRASAATLGLSDCPDAVTESCIKSLQSGSIVRLDTAAYINDFILMQISWVYDLTTYTARRMLHERGYIPLLASYLPVRSDISKAVEKAMISLST